MHQLNVSAATTDAAAEALEAFFPNVAIGSGGTGAFFFEMDTFAGGDLTLLDYRLGGRPLRPQVSETDGYMFCLSERVAGHISQGRQEVDVSRPWVLRPGTRARYDAAHARVVSVAASRVEQHLENTAGRTDGGRFRFVASAPRSAPFDAYWRSVMGNVDAAMRSGAIDNPLVAAPLTELVVSASMHCFASTWQPGEVREVATTASLRRAMAFAEENAHLPLRVADMAASARLSARGLQDAFRRELGVTPMEYLRGVRLDGARRDLLTSDARDGDTVAAIAARWGFVQPGRFAQRYRAQFGELPRETLRTRG